MAVTETLFAESPYVRRARRAGARHRLFCFPHAGAGASSFSAWTALLPPELELIAIQLPGREDRSAEAPVTEVEPLVRTLGVALRPYLRGSFSFFGHSGGALLAFELARALHRRGAPGPAHLFLSGQQAPDQPRAVPPIHALPEPEFRAAVAELGGLTDAVSGDPELMDLLAGTLRADFTLWENHVFTDGPPIPASIVALGGRDDRRAPVAGVEAWRRYTVGEFHAEFFDGGHFYLDRRLEELLGTVTGIALGTAGHGERYARR